MKSLLTGILLLFSVYSNAVPVTNEGTTELVWKKENFRPPHFTLPIYKATVLDNNAIEIMDGPIIMENIQQGMYFVVTSDNYEDYALHPIVTNVTDQTQIQLELTSTEPISREFDIIILEALDEDLVPIARTTVLVFNTNSELDMYKMKFKLDDSEYIVLNYFYFKWFLALLTITGLLILVIELHEIVKNVRVAREHGYMRQNGKYREMSHI